MRACCTYASCDKKTPVETAEFTATPSPKPKNRALHFGKQIYDEVRLTQALIGGQTKFDLSISVVQQSNEYISGSVYVTSYLLLVEVVGIARFDD